MQRVAPENCQTRAQTPRAFLGKIGAVFLIVEPPAFGLAFWLAASLGSPGSDTLHLRIQVALGLAFSFYGLLASYAVGVVPALIAGLTYSRIRRHFSGSGTRLGLAALIGAAVYFPISSLAIGLVLGNRLGADWAFATFVTGDAAFGGAISAFICALIVEN